MNVKATLFSVCFLFIALPTASEAKQESRVVISLGQPQSGYVHYAHNNRHYRGSYRTHHHKRYYNPRYRGNDYRPKVIWSLRFNQRPRYYRCKVYYHKRWMHGAISNRGYCMVRYYGGWKAFRYYRRY